MVLKSYPECFVQYLVDPVFITFIQFVRMRICDEIHWVRDSLIHLRFDSVRLLEQRLHSIEVCFGAFRADGGQAGL